MSTALQQTNNVPSVATKDRTSWRSLIKRKHSPKADWILCMDTSYYFIEANLISLCVNFFVQLELTESVFVRLQLSDFVA